MNPLINAAAQDLAGRGHREVRHLIAQLDHGALLFAHHLVTGMSELGFRRYLADELQGPIITSFHYPAHPRFKFEEFYGRLSDRGFVIYPGKLSKVDCFRIGTIGRIFPRDVQQLVAAVAATVREMGVDPRA